MNNPIRNLMLSLVLLFIFIMGCQPNQAKADLAEKIFADEKESTPNPAEEEIKITVEKLLIAAGNYNIEDLDDMTSDKAMLGISSLKDGLWSNSEITIDEYFENVKNRDLNPYCEIVNDYNFLVTEDRLALVRADAILHRFGIPQTREINHFTLLNENGSWKFLNISFTVTQIAEVKKKFDLDIFARSYAQAWGSKRPAFVALYFTKDGVQQVNDGEPANGREAISRIAQGFMSDLPDMIVQYDSLVSESDRTKFHWTLIATNSGPNGNGHRIRVSGYELWQMEEGGLIEDSKGSFPSEEYNRQLEFGVD